MGNRGRFRLSDMMPNSWRLHKLKDTHKTTSADNITRPSSNNIVHPTNSNTMLNNIKSTASTLPHPTATATANPRKSYHIPRDVDPPRRSSKHARTPKKSSKPPPPPHNKANSLGNFSCRASTDSVWTRTTELDPDDSPDSIIFGSSSPDLRLDRVLTPESRGSCGSKTDPAAIHDDHDVVIYVDNNSFVAKPKRPMLGLNHNSESITKMELPRILTKPKQGSYDALDHSGFDVRDAKKPAKNIKEDNSTGGRRKSLSRRHYSLSTSPRLRLKINSPKLSGRRPTSAAQARKTGTESSASMGRRKLSGSFAVVKSSFDPQRDFRESMVEMIVEHNIKASKDLEELLACYLTLNSDEYHELIIEVFKQIWFDLTDVHLIE